MERKKIYYQAIGSVRGSCGHLHRTIEAAEKCCEKDKARCSRMTGRCYSDREVYAVDREGRIIEDHNFNYLK